MAAGYLKRNGASRPVRRFGYARARMDGLAFAYDTHHRVTSETWYNTVAVADTSAHKLVVSVSMPWDFKIQRIRSVKNPSTI